MGSDPIQRLLTLLEEPPEHPDTSLGYLNLLGEAVQAGPSTGFGQRLMHTRVVPAIYERYWRPVLGRVAKGVTGPSMAGERRLAKGMLAIQPGQVVLDVACGTGEFTRSFGRAVGPEGLAIGLDASTTMLARAVTATPTTAPVAFLRADAVHPPLREQTVDGVCCFAALHMFAEPAAALESFARILKPGGRLALLTTGRHPGGPVRTVATAFGAWTGQVMFERGEVAGLLRERGFTDVEERFAAVAQFVGARRG